MVQEAFGLHVQSEVSVFVPQKPIGGTLQTRMYQRILTKIGGDREMVCITKDQPAFALEIIISKVTLDSLRPPSLAQPAAGGYQEPTAVSVSNTGFSVCMGMHPSKMLRLTSNLV